MIVRDYIGNRKEEISAYLHIYICYKLISMFETKIRQSGRFDLLKIFPEFNLFKPKGRDAEYCWFEEGYQEANERRILVLQMCIEMCKR